MCILNFFIPFTNIVLDDNAECDLVRFLYLLASVCYSYDLQDTFGSVLQVILLSVSGLCRVHLIPCCHVYYLA